MPLHHGRTAKGIKASVGKNIKQERHAGYPRKQAVAIALSTARSDAKKAHVKVRGLGKARKRK